MRLKNVRLHALVGTIDRLESIPNLASECRYPNAPALMRAVLVIERSSSLLLRVVHHPNDCTDDSEDDCCRAGAICGCLCSQVGYWEAGERDFESTSQAVWNCYSF